MEINLGEFVIQVSDTQMLSIFWAFAVFLAFNVAYLLFVNDRGASDISRSRMWATVLIGSLLVIGTYADMLASKPFALKDCILLAFVGAHGWMAEEMVNKFMKKAPQI